MNFTSHNIQLDDGTWTKPECADENMAWVQPTRNLLNLVFPGDKSKYRIVDLACLEGGYTTAFARMGFQSLGIEVRSSNIECCNYVKSKVDLPNLNFVQDNIINIDKYGEFDASFCCGVLYHLDKPASFLRKLASQTKKMIIIQTHFALDDNGDFSLSGLVAHDGVRGKWIQEFRKGEDQETIEALRWSSYHNHQSFWIYRTDLIQLIHDLGFETVLEQFDSFAWRGNSIAKNMDETYNRQLRGTFIGIRS